MKKVLIVGAGGIGKKHIDGFLRTGEVSISICDVDVSRINRIKNEYSVEEAFSDFHSISLKLFDAVVIATPANYHIPMAIKCAEAGIPFLVEKPLSVDMKGIDKLVNIIEKNNVHCAVGFTRRSIPSFIKLKEILKRKCVIPRVTSFIGGCDYRKYRPDYKEIYFAKKSTGGGCILDSVSHIVDLAQWYLGSPSDGFCIYDNLVFGDVVKTEDCAVIGARFGNCLVSISNNLFQKPYTMFIEFAGEEGNLRYVMDDKGSSFITFASDDSGRWEKLVHFENEIPDYYLYQAKNFLNLLEGKDNTLTSIKEAVINLEFLLKIKMSRKDGTGKS